MSSQIKHYIIQCVPIKAQSCPLKHSQLTHWGPVTHICIGKLIIIGWDNGLSPDRPQAIISTNAGLLSIGPLRTYFSENLIKIQQFSLKKMHLKMASAKWRPSCLDLNELMTYSSQIRAMGEGVCCELKVWSRCTLHLPCCMQTVIWLTMWCPYNMVHFFSNCHK